MRTCRITTSKQITNDPMPVLIPCSLEYYGPRYKLEVLSNNMDDYNSKEYLNSIK